MTDKKNDALTRPDFRDRIREMREVELARITDFSGSNPKKPSREFIAQLDASLMKNGYSKPFLVVDTQDGKFMTLDGHTRRERIQHLWPHIKRVKVLILDVTTESEGKLLMMGLMASGEYDESALDAWVRAGLANGLDVDDVMDVSGFTAATLESIAEASAELIKSTHQSDRDEEDKKPDPHTPEPPRATGGGMVREVDIPDEIPPAKKTVTRLGDIWKLGDHRLVCGDMTVPEVLEAAMNGASPQLLWSDPPWNVAVASGARELSPAERKKAGKNVIANDDLGKNFPEFAARFASGFAASCPPGVPCYIVMADGESWSITDMAMRAAGFHWSSTIIWAKQSFVLGRKDFHSQHEGIWYGWREGAPRICAPSDRSMSDVWTIDRPRKSEQHPSMKPVALVARSINASSKPGDLVLDPFGGSGTTLLAAEQMGRRSALVELSPSYCDVIVERYQWLTGKKAKRVAA